MIIEKIEGEVFAYREDEAHYQTVKSQRTSKRIRPRELGWDCELSEYPDDCYMVFKLKDQR